MFQSVTYDSMNKTHVSLIRTSMSKSFVTQLTQKIPFNAAFVFEVTIEGELVFVEPMASWTMKT